MVLLPKDFLGIRLSVPFYVLRLANLGKCSAVIPVEVSDLSIVYIFTFIVDRVEVDVGNINIYIYMQTSQCNLIVKLADSHDLNRILFY